MPAPKLFISYCWTNPDHEAWVLQLATELRQSGIDAVLDKWDLREGHDAHAFMERMVTDSEIKKVALVCDRAYAEKADKRAGGVGTEAQIISADIYAKVEQDKFVAVVTERDSEGRPLLPAYYKSRVYIDLSDQASYTANLEKLIRWVFDKPLYQKPEVGVPPDYLDDAAAASRLAVSPQWRRAVEAVRSKREYAESAAKEYFSALASELERLRLPPGAEPIDQAVIDSVEAFLPYRNQAVELLLALAANYPESSGLLIHRFLEQLLPYLERPEHVTQWREADFDNYRFIVHELFLYALASLIKHECFLSAATLLSTDYYAPHRTRQGADPMIPFSAFREHMKSLEYRKQRLKSNRLSIRSDLLVERATGTSISATDLMQADFVLFLRDNLDRPEDHWNWWPETLLYAQRLYGPFELFARSRSTRYFQTAMVLLGIAAKEPLVALFDSFARNERLIPTWQGYSFNPRILAAADTLASRP